MPPTITDRIEALSQALAAWDNYAWGPFRSPEEAAEAKPRPGSPEYLARAAAAARQLMASLQEHCAAVEQLLTGAGRDPCPLIRFRLGKERDFIAEARVTLDVARALAPEPAGDTKPRRPPLFIEFPERQRQILLALAGKGKVEYREVREDLYPGEGRDADGAFRSLWKRTAEALAARAPSWQLRRKGGALWLADVTTGEPWTPPA
jgi:hypothetical protein